MAEWVMVFFTGVIAMTTIIYAFYNYRLWRETRASVRLQKFSEMMLYIQRIESWATYLKTQSPHKGHTVDQISAIAIDFIFSNLLEGVKIDSKDPTNVEYVAKLEVLYKEMGWDIRELPGVGEMVKRMEDERKRKARR